MQAVKRPYVMAAAALAATSLVAAVPLATQARELAVRSIETRLVDQSIWNIPFNLFQDIVNIPYYEVQGLDALAGSEFMTGTWFVVSPTNLWGVDPGDPSHFMALTDILLPIPGLSGFGSPETDFNAGLGQQLWPLVAAELPVNGACDAASCIPTAPTSPITGITSIDTFIWLEQELSGAQQFPLIDNWFRVPLSDLLNGYTFNPNAPGSVDPSGPAVGMFGYAPTGPGDAMPWSGLTYTLQPWVPIENWLNSLENTPNLNGFEFPTLTEFFQALQAVFAGAIVDFDPFTPGSPFCPGTCSILPDSLNYPALVQDVSNIMPGNPIIDQWLAAYTDPTGGPGISYNGPTEAQILNSELILQQGFWDFGNPSPPPGSGPDYSQVTALFHQLYEDLGIQPGQGVAASATDPSAALPGGLDFTQMSSDWNALTASLEPTQVSADLSALLATFDPSTLSADLSTMLANFTTTLSADLATILPSTLLSSF